MEDKKFEASFVIGLVLTVIISVNTSLFKDSDSPASFILLVVMYFGLSMLVFFALNSLATGVKNTKEKVDEIIKERQLNSEIYIQCKKQEKDFSEVKNTHKYFSDEKLLHLFETKHYKNNTFKQMALEEILFERKLISHSGTHEKMHNLKEYFLNDKN